MKVLELYENTQIASAEEFKTSFTQDEWNSIFCYYISQQDEDVGIVRSVRLSDDPNAAAQRKSQMEKLIGPLMPNNTTESSWITHARRFGISNVGRSWTGFYNALKQHVGKECTITFGSGTTSDRPIVHSHTTPETVETLMSWSNVPDPITTAEDISKFLVDLYKKARSTPARSERDAGGHTWRAWAEAQSATIEPGTEENPVDTRVLMVELANIQNEQVAKIEAGQPPSKRDVAIVFQAWLRMADTYIETNRSRNQ